MCIYYSDLRVLHRRLLLHKYRSPREVIVVIIVITAIITGALTVDRPRTPDPKTMSRRDGIFFFFKSFNEDRATPVCRGKKCFKNFMKKKNPPHTNHDELTCTRIVDIVK